MHSILCVVLTEQEKSCIIFFAGNRKFLSMQSVPIQKLPFPSFCLCKHKSQDLCTQKMSSFVLHDEVLSMVVLRLRLLLL